MQPGLQSLATNKEALTNILTESCLVRVHTYLLKYDVIIFYQLSVCVIHLIIFSNAILFEARDKAVERKIKHRNNFNSRFPTLAKRKDLMPNGAAAITKADLPLSLPLFVKVIVKLF